MTVAWVSHHLPYSSTEAHHLPGEYAGGAEMTDAAWVASAPVDLVIIPPDDWAAALEMDHVIITGTDLLTDEAMQRLAGTRPVVFVHHEQTRTPARKMLLDSAEVLIVHTPAHLAREMEWLDPRRTATALSPLLRAEISSTTKEPFALWAQRQHPLKGPLAARLWAAQHGIPLTMMSDAPRAEVLATMARAEWFVHLPLGFESESRATMEAVLSGCTCVVNTNVGIASVPGWDDPERLAEMLDGAADEFWRLALP